MKDKNLAAILALVMGSIGAHKFYLGKPMKGILYLLFSWTSIPFLVSLVEGVQYLTMSQDQFDLKHNAEQLLLAHRREQYRQLGQGQRGGAGARRSVAPPPKKKNKYKISGDKKYKNHDFDGAIKDYNLALKVDPRQKDVHFNLACMYSLLERSEEAYHHLSKAVEFGTSPKKIQSHDSLVYLRSSPIYNDFVRNGYKVPRPRSKQEQRIEKMESLDANGKIYDEIKKLAKLNKKGVLTDAEFEQQKARLLNKLDFD